MDESDVQFEDEYGNIYYLDENGMFRRMGEADPKMSQSLMDLAKRRMMDKYEATPDTPSSWFFSTDTKPKAARRFKPSTIPDTLKEMVEGKKS